MRKKSREYKITADSDRIQITPVDYFRTIRRIGYAALIVSLHFPAMLLITRQYTPLSITISILLIILSLGLISFLGNRSYVISLKGDTLIHLRSNNRSYLTSIRSIGNLKNTNLLFLNLTRYCFRLDGIQRKVFLIEGKRRGEESAYSILHESKEKYKKEKANHKPGPVIT